MPTEAVLMIDDLAAYPHDYRMVALTAQRRAGTLCGIVDNYLASRLPHWRGLESEVIARAGTLFFVAFAILSVTGQRLLASPDAPPVADRTPQVVDATVIYHSMVVPQVTPDEWLDAWRELGFPDGRESEAMRAIEAYAEQISAICNDFGKYCAERELRECLTGMRAENPGAEEAIQECFARLRSRVWPQTDAAIDNTWAALTTDIDPKDTAKADAAQRAKASLLRRVLLRHISSPTSWSYGGEGLDLRSVMHSGSQDGALDQDLRDVLKLASDAPTNDIDHVRAEIRHAVDVVRAVLVSFEDSQASTVQAFFRTYREGALVRPERGKDPRLAAESRHTKRARAAREMRVSLFKAISEITQSLRRDLGEVAAAEWDERALTAALPEAFQEESPTAVIHWLQAHDRLDLQRKQRYIDYVQARAQLRTQVIDLLLDAKQASPAPLRSGDPAFDRVRALTEQRRSLSETAVQDMLNGLDPDDRQAVESFLLAVRRRWDPAKPWRNI